MAKVNTVVSIDPAVLRQLEDVAVRLERSRDDLIEDSVRRDLASQLLDRVFAEIDGADGVKLSQEQASALATEELDQLRAERRSSELS